MSTIAAPSHSSGFSGWLSRAEAWLDDKGKGAWIAAMVLSFIVFWPLGLALLAYMIWSKKKICQHTSRRSCRRGSKNMSTKRSSGNAAFDSYRNDTLNRLEEEQQNFEAFLQRLRDARDKAEFDQFMDERASSREEDQNESATKS